jgi:hypothetical protein
MAFKILNRTFVFFGGGAGIEGSQITLSSRSRIKFARIKPVLSTGKFSYHKKPVDFSGEPSCRDFLAKGMPERYWL